MDVLEALLKRRSVRKYKSTPVEKDIIKKIIDAGRLAPTARNIQPWEFVVVTDKKMREKIADITEYGKFIAQAPVCIVVFCKDTKYFLEDGCAATVNMLLAAEGLGLKSCWVAGDKKPYCGTIAEILGVPSDYKLISFVPVGYSDESPQSPSKRTLKEITHWEKF